MSQNIICWTDIPVTDLNRAIAFYTAVLDAPITRQNAGTDIEFGILPHASDGVSGCLVEMSDRKPSRNGPQIYLSVEGRLDAAIAAVKAGGGEVLQEKHPLGPYGFRAVIVDSEGNALALHSSKP